MIVVSPRTQVNAMTGINRASHRGSRARAAALAAISARRFESLDILIERLQFNRYYLSDKLGTMISGACDSNQHKSPAATPLAIPLAFSAIPFKLCRPCIRQVRVN